MEAGVPGEIQFGELSVGLSGYQLGSHHGNFFRARTVAKAQQRLPLGFNIGFRLLGLKLKYPCVQNTDHVTGFDPVSLLRAKLGNPAITIEGKRNLPDVHIAIED